MPNEKGELEAVQMYKTQGVGPWRSSSDCWSNKIPSGAEFNLAVVRAPEGKKWSQIVKTLVLLEENTIVYHSDPDFNFERRVNENDNLVFKKGVVNDKITARSLEFRGLGGRDGLVTIVVQLEGK